jgi:hypothetical protein
MEMECSRAAGTVLGMRARSARESIRTALGDTRFCCCGGARQVGKRTLAQALSAGPRSRRVRTLDDGATLSAAQRDPEGSMPR